MDTNTGCKNIFKIKKGQMELFVECVKCHPLQVININYSQFKRPTIITKKTNIL